MCVTGKGCVAIPSLSNFGIRRARYLFRESTWVQAANIHGPANGSFLTHPATEHRMAETSPHFYEDQ